jgi:hypothetical protein
MKNLQSPQRISSNFGRFKKSISPKRSQIGADLGGINFGFGLVENTNLGSNSNASLNSSYRSSHDKKFPLALNTVQNYGYEQQHLIKKAIKLCEKCKKVSCLCGETSYAKLKETEYRLTANHFQSRKQDQDRAKRAFSSSKVCKPRLSASLYKPYKFSSKQFTPDSKLVNDNFLCLMDDRKPQSVSDSFSIPRLKQSNNSAFNIEHALSTKGKILVIGREYIKKYYSDVWSMRLIETLCSYIMKLMHHRNKTTQNYNDKLMIIADFLDEHAGELDLERRLLKETATWSAEKRKMLYLERFRYLLFAMSKDMMV